MNRGTFIDKAVASANQNLAAQQPALDLVPWRPGAEILDIGCGPGVHCEYFAEKGMKPTGLDRSSDTFQFHGKYNFVDDISKLNNKKFDFVFASHVLEHCPDVISTLRAWRDLLYPGGALVVFVPPYTPEVSNDHWIVGWNVGQLSVLLVAAGFDCRMSHFGQYAQQVFGYGIKAECSEAGFSIEQSLQWLPPPLAAGMISYPTGVNLRGDVASLNRNSITYLSRHPTTLRVGHDIDWHEIEAGDEWGDVEINIQRLTLSTSAEFIIAVRCEAGKGAMRFCLISDKGADAVEQSRELWIELMPGLQLLRFSLGEMRCQTGNLEISKAKRAYFGGPRSGLGKIHFALLDVNGCQVA